MKEEKRNCVWPKGGRGKEREKTEKRRVYEKFIEKRREEYYSGKRQGGRERSVIKRGERE